jgi:hydrogenase maturation protease
MSTLVLGVGNSILTDDGIGILVAREIKERNPELEVIETSEGGLAFLDHMVGCDKLIIVDSVKSGQGEPGELYKLDLEDLKPASDVSSSHGVSIATAFKLGQKLGYKMPESVSIYAIEIKDNSTFGEGCTEEIERIIPSTAKKIMEEEKL